MLNLLIPTVLSIGVLYLNQEKLLLLGKKLNYDWKPSIQYDYEEIFLPVKDGKKTLLQNAFYIKSKSQPSRGVVLYYHGNQANLQIAQEYCLPFLENNYDVLMMDYRGYGKSQGKITKSEHLLDDSLIWYDWIKENTNHTNIVAVGKSLGSGLATYLCSQRNINLLMLITPYDTLKNVANYNYPYLPIKTLMKYLIPSKHWIKDVNCPIRIIHGNQDELISPDMANNLFQEGKSLNKNIGITWLDDAKHDNLHMYLTYYKWISDCLNRAKRNSK